MSVVARAGLEQLAWALTASTATSSSELGAFKSSAEIANLKQLYPAAGRLYGRLSQSAHMDAAEHLGLVSHLPGGIAIDTREDTLHWGSVVLLRLGDAWLAVWEVSQQGHLPSLNHVALRDDQWHLIEDRPFIQEAAAVTREVQAHLAERATWEPTEGDL